MKKSLRQIANVSIMLLVFTGCMNQALQESVDHQSILEKYCTPALAQRILKTADPLLESQITHIEKMKGGRSTSQIFQLTCDDRVYALRVCDKNRSLDFYTSPTQEITCNLIANQLGICPKIHFANTDDGFIIMDYISSVPYSRILESQRIEFYGKLASAISKIHQGPTFPNTTSIFEDIELAKSQIRPDFISEIALQAFQSVKKSQLVLSKHLESVPCHKELNFANILYDNEKLYIIDWETAGNSDPYVDLAIASNFLIYNPEDERFFLESYFQSSMTAEQKAKYYLMQQACMCLYAFKILRRIGIKEKFDVSKEQLSVLPSFKEFTKGVVTNEIKLDNLENFRNYASIFFREVINYTEDNRYEESIQCLSK